MVRPLVTVVGDTGRPRWSPPILLALRLLTDPTSEAIGRWPLADPLSEPIDLWPLADPLSEGVEPRRWDCDLSGTISLSLGVTVDDDDFL